MVVILENRIKHRGKILHPGELSFLLMRGYRHFSPEISFLYVQKYLSHIRPFTPKELHCFGCPSVPDQNVARYLAKCNIMNLIVFYCVGLR